jgi:hypothetical protein
MDGNGNARRRGDSGCSLPACDAADPHKIRHDVIARLHLQGGVERAPLEDITDLDRRFQVGGQSRVTLKVVVDARNLTFGVPTLTPEHHRHLGVI